MPLPLASALISMIPSVYQFIQGQKQGRMAERFARTPRPVYNIPKPIYENIATAKNLAGGEMPGSDFLRGRYDRILSNAASNARMSGTNAASILGTISNVAASAMDKEAELGYKGAQYRSEMTDRLMNARNMLARYEDEAFDWNKKQPYLDAMAAASALKHAEITNKYNAINEAVKPWVSYLAGVKKKDDDLTGILGSASSGSSPVGLTGKGLQSGWQTSDYNLTPFVPSKTFKKLFSPYPFNDVTKDYPFNPNYGKIPYATY